MKKLETLLEKFQGNAYPAMLEDLGHHLGVSADSIRRLAPGWAPIVEFKNKKTSSIGWWVIPERDAHGEPVGLSLRSQGDYKVMFPGSKHGLVYEVNPNHERGGKGYDAGASNWIRTMDAGIECPICGKPDGCLLSSENAADPKAVVCIRVRAGSEKPLRFGHLHIRKAEGKLKHSSALAGDPAEYVIVVEGFSDTAAALDLGFSAVGRPSNLAGMEDLKELVRGRRILIVGENDKKPDGTEPGREGMVATFQVLNKVCSDIRMVMPPTHIKDLRVWKVKYDLTREGLLEHVEKEGQAKAANTVIIDNRPLTIARAYLDDQHRMAGRYLIRRWSGNWYRYEGAKYKEIANEAFEGPIYPWSHDKLVQTVNQKTGAESLTPLRADTGLIANVTAAIMSETMVNGDEVPCWVNQGKGPSPQDLIVFSNGIVHVPSFLEGKSESDYLLDLTPDFFTTSALPFAFDPTADCPNWKKFLRTSLGDEQEKIMLLREWFGYCLTPDTKMQKLMYLRGPSGAGKSIAINVLCAMVGSEQAASTSFTDLTGSFGLQPLIGKLVCVIPDARSPRGNDHMRGLEILLNVTSGDAVQVNRKNVTAVARMRLTARITIASNEFLDIPDNSGAMLRRLNIIEFRKSFVGKEDFDLERKCVTEVPGIALWALTGLKRLREQGRFTIPSSSKEASGEWRTSTSPMAAFVEECCDPVAEGETLKNELFDAWEKWSYERRLIPLSKSKFWERLRSIAPFVSSHTYMEGTHKRSIFKGIVLKEWAAKKLLGRP